MASFGFLADGEWENFSKIFSTEELDFTEQFLGRCNSFPQQYDDRGLHFITSSSFCPTSEANVSMTAVNESLFYSSNTLNCNLQNLTQDSSFSSNCRSSAFNPTSTHETAAYFFSDSNHSPMTNDESMSIDISVMNEKKIGLHDPAFPDIAMEETAPLNQYISGNKSSGLDNVQPAIGIVPANELQLKRKFDVPALHTGENDKINVNPSKTTKKKPRVSRYNVQSKKNQNLSPKGNEGEVSNGGSDGQSSTSYSSEEDNASQETNGGATSDSKASLSLNLNGKPRASRGSATDPQSIYARKRRERINERLKILQNLVPNGTKVDISKMLEEEQSIM